MGRRVAANVAAKAALLVAKATLPGTADIMGVMGKPCRMVTRTTMDKAAEAVPIVVRELETAAMSAPVLLVPDQVK